MIITGYYNEQGYQVEDNWPCHAVIYRAGNHALESQQDGTGTAFQLPLDTIRRYCETTTRLIAREKHARFGGVEYLESDEI